MTQPQQPEQTQQPGQPGSDRATPPVSDAASALAGDVRDLVRAELTAAWGQIREAGARSAVAAALFGGAAALGLAAAHAGSTMLLRTLEAGMPKPAAAASLAALYAAGATSLAVAGRRTLQAAQESASRAAQQADQRLRAGA
jgi:hypothetical protein